jgi:hypothetical protein
VHTHTIDIHASDTASPYWSRAAPKDVSLAEEETVELECDADGDPAPIRRWYMNGVPIGGVARACVRINVWVCRCGAQLEPDSVE